MSFEQGPHDYYKHGDNNIACSMCGRKLKLSEAVRNWQGQYRHTYCNEPRQPQDFARGIPENMAAPVVQPEVIVFSTICSINTQSAIPGVGGPGCMIPGNAHWDPNGF